MQIRFPGKHFSYRFNVSKTTGLSAPLLLELNGSCEVVAELADAQDLGSCVPDVWVQVPSTSELKSGRNPYSLLKLRGFCRFYIAPG